MIYQQLPFGVDISGFYCVLLFYFVIFMAFCSSPRFAFYD